MTEYTQVEAAVSDLLWVFSVGAPGPGAALRPLRSAGQLTNARREASRGQGIERLRTLIDAFGAPPLTTTTPMLLVAVGDWSDAQETLAAGGSRAGYGFRREWLIPAVRSAHLGTLADSTRYWCKLDESRAWREGISHAAAVNRGVTRALFAIDDQSWELANGRRGFRAEAVTSGAFWEETVGPHGHRVPKRSRGRQSTIRYWPFAAQPG